jgi:hypothetical protein
MAPIGSRLMILAVFAILVAISGSGTVGAQLGGGLLDFWRGTAAAEKDARTNGGSGGGYGGYMAAKTCGCGPRRLGCRVGRLHNDA